MVFRRLPDPVGSAAPRCIEIGENGVVVHDRALTRPLLPGEMDGAVYIGTEDGEDCYAVTAGEDAVLTPYRGLLFSLEPAAMDLLSTGRALHHWHRRTRFCGACGHETSNRIGERARECFSCGEIFYPQIAPVVMVAVVNGEGKLLLARNASFGGNRHSVLAGFVEAGETLEEAAVREVAEEVGVRIDDLRYRKSQFWPFPGSLIAAFTARHAGGDIRCDGVEIVEAGWYGPEDHPPLPGPGSISRFLVDSVLFP